ncbi:MAG: hypothetical protein JJ863_17520 [Deltaproteobacteria bacterium]|nr:hypothetical protein [Deltaproteobacteria bacterium]
MAKRLTEDEKKLLEEVPETDTRGNISIQRALKWPKDRYLKAREKLLAKGILAVGKGKGGSVRRVDDDVRALIETMPADRTVTNPWLQEALGWEDEIDRYWEAQRRARDFGLIQVGPGRGGTLRLAGRAKLVAAPSIDASESRYYEPLRRTLVRHWVKENNLDQCVVDITAYQGSKDTGGIWSRPDLTVFSLRQFDLLPGHYFDVWTFEVKPPDSWDITVVHEALAHARFATRPYALVVLPPSLHEDPHQDLRFVECVKAARKHGVGFMTVDKPSDFETWVTWVEPERHDPDPQLTHDFLTQQLSDRALDSSFDLLAR